MMIQMCAERFDFDAAVRSHGWYQLAPFSWDPERRELGRVERLNSGRVVRLRLSARSGAGDPVGAEERTRLCAAVDLEGPLQAAELDELVSKARWMLRLDEDYREFQELCGGAPGLVHVAAGRKGRILRSSTVFEDAVKTVCTTNTTWRQVRACIGRLVAGLGEPLPAEPSLKCFPPPERVVAAGVKYLEEEVRLGYRAPYVAALAATAANGELEQLKDWAQEPEALRRRLLQLPGVGPYAAAHLMVLLGMYDFVPIDGWARKEISRAFYGGREISDREAAAAFDNWGRWKALAFWFYDWESKGSG